GVRIPAPRVRQTDTTWSDSCGWGRCGAARSERGPVRPMPRSAAANAFKITESDRSEFRSGLKVNAEIARLAIKDRGAHLGPLGSRGDTEPWFRSGEVSLPALHHDRCLWRHGSGFRTCSSTNGDHGTPHQPGAVFV